MISDEKVMAHKTECIAGKENIKGRKVFYLF